MPKKGYKQSSEHKKKMVETRMQSNNYKQSDKSINKMVETRIRNDNYKHSRISKDRISKSIKGKQIGRVFREETKTKLSASKKNYHDNLTDDEKTARNKRLSDARNARKTNDTGPERIFEALLQKKGLIEHIDYEKQYEIGYYHVDFFLIRQNMCVEVNGCYPHCCEKCGYNKESYGVPAKEVRSRDEERIKFLKSQGYNVKIIWQHQLMPQK